MVSFVLECTVSFQRECESAINGIIFYQRELNGLHLSIDCVGPTTS